MRQHNAKCNQRSSTRRESGREEKREGRGFARIDKIAQRAALLVFGDGGAAGAYKFAERTSQLVSHFVSVSRMNNFD